MDVEVPKETISTLCRTIAELFQKNRELNLSLRREKAEKQVLREQLWAKKIETGQDELLEYLAKQIDKEEGRDG
ncbi:MAG: hypothetical protein CEN89_225 [Candidatus Berkelbacteria bacterium Licking1014_7]|uniref:Uncharacterized protein n=1 Tax=Candidatus Berkelbacteria bacterium Licking1014_7 TaxID=2017147 RepID=A0A554LK07_9BACT|nr:MAG: hypothetical protein CEN89_225 [Candidatus Berkelbacteria bacterium Licking1014_7]